MLNIGLQFFAHKKGMAPPRTAVIPSPSAWVPSVRMVSTFWPATFWFASVARTSTPVPTWAVAPTTPCCQANGVVRFERLGKDRKQVSVYPAE